MIVGNLVDVKPSLACTTKPKGTTSLLISSFFSFLGTIVIGSLSGTLKTDFAPIEQSRTLTGVIVADFEPFKLSSKLLILLWLLAVNRTVCKKMCKF